MAETKHNNALSEYDNTVAPSNNDNALKNKFKGMLDAVSGGDIAKLNKLEAKMKSFNLGSTLGKFSGAISGLISSQLSMVALLKDDALRALENSATSFAMNIVEQFAKDIKATLYVDDSAFLIVVKGLYYAGGDLAYNGSYIRKTALSRDWIGTLKFCDEEYGIDYNLQYTDLSNDLSYCSRNSCWKNLKYIYSCMLINYNKEITERNLKERLLSTMDRTDKNYDSISEIVSNLNKNIKAYEKLMVDNLKKLITYSYSYLTPGQLKGFFDDFGMILKPKYFGTTDDKYGNSYNFNDSDINVMMPFFVSHKLTDSDKYIQNQVSAQSTEIKQTVKDLKKESLQTENSDDPKIMGRNRAISSLKSFTSSVLSKQSDRSGLLTRDALQYGSGKVFKDSRAKYNKNISNNANRVVKYKDRKSIGDHLEDAFVDKDRYITTRNNNIKSIYILLTNVDLFGQDVMVNEKFYTRCKYKTMTAINSAYDKAKALLPTSGIIQGLLNVSDALDASIYDYEQTVEKYLFDPKVNVSLDTLQFATLQFDPNAEDLILPTTDDSSVSTTGGALGEKATETQSNSQSGSQTGTQSDHIGGSNTSTTSEIEKALDGDLYVKKTIADATRYLNNFPMIQKKNLIVKYLTWFYNTCIELRGISETTMGEKFSQLVYSIIGVSQVKTPSELELKFVNTTNDSLSDNLRTMISVSELYLFNYYVNTKNIDTISRNSMIDTYNQAMYLLRYEMLMLSFIRGVFVHDNEYLLSFAKQLFKTSEEAVDEMVQLNQPFYKVYNFKDVISKYFKNYDHYGILGYDDSVNRIKYTNIVIGDFNTISKTNIGLYFLGNSLTNTGVKYFNELTQEIENTNQTTGNWTRVVNSDSGPIFVKDNKELWTVKPTNPIELLPMYTNDYMNWELVYIPEYSLTILISIKNEGVKVYNKNTRRFVNTIITTGSDYKYSITKAGVVFYSETTSSGIYFYNNKQFHSTPVTTGKFSSYYDYIESITVENSSTDSSGQETTTVSFGFNYHFLFASLDNLGVIDLYSVSIDNEKNESPSKFDTPSLQVTTSISEGSCKIYPTLNDSACVLFIKSNDNFIENKDDFSTNEIYYRLIDGVYEPILDLNDFNNPEVDIYYIFRTSQIIKPKTEAQSSPNNPQFTTIDLVGLSEPNDVNLIDSGLIFNAKTINVTSSGPYRTIVENSIFINNGLTNIKQLGISLPTNGIIESSFISTTNGDEYCIMECKLDDLSNIFHKKSGLSLWESILDPEDNTLNKYGWKFKLTSNGKLLFINNYNNLGIGSIVDNKLIISNINDGNWEIVETPSKYLIYSINGSNKGIKVSNKTILNFDNPPNTIKSYNDFGCHYYDNRTKRLFLGTLRDKVKFNVKLINYDIDEFIYGLTTVNLHNLLTKYTQEIFEMLLEYIERRIKNSSFIYYKIKKNEEPKPLKGKTYYTKDGDNFALCGNIEVFEDDIDYYISLLPETFEMMKESGDLSDNDVVKVDMYTLVNQLKVLKPNPNTTYYIKNPDYTPVTGIETWDRGVKYYVKGEINYDILKSEMSKTLDSFTNIQKSSGFYTDITDLAKARQEFDIDDGKIVNGISLDMILNSSDKNTLRSLLNYKARNRQTIISTIDVDDGPDVDKTSDEWLKTHNFTSVAYLDSDDYELI